MAVVGGVDGCWVRIVVVVVVDGWVGGGRVGVEVAYNDEELSYS